MKVKLTLALEKAVVEKAENFAQKTGRSLSDLIKSYLESLDQEHSELSPNLRKLVGAVQLPDDFDEKEEMRFGLEEKHLI